jgi:hypothetical protein
MSRLAAGLKMGLTWTENNLDRLAWSDWPRPFLPQFAFPLT